MGNKSSNAAVQKELIDDFHQGTHYNKIEVRQLYKQFSGLLQGRAQPPGTMVPLVRLE